MPDCNDWDITAEEAARYQYEMYSCDNCGCPTVRLIEVDILLVCLTCAQQESETGKKAG